MPAVDERRRSAAVQVDRLARTEGDHQPRQLAELESRVDAGAAPVAAHRQQLAVADSPRSRVRNRKSSYAMPSGMARISLRAPLRAAGIMRAALSSQRWRALWSRTQDDIGHRRLRHSSPPETKT
jgi:hypothetical protein